MEDSSAMAKPRNPVTSEAEELPPDSEHTLDFGSDMYNLSTQITPAGDGSSEVLYDVVVQEDPNPKSLLPYDLAVQHTNNVPTLPLGGAPHGHVTFNDTPPYHVQPSSITSCKSIISQANTSSPENDAATIFFPSRPSNEEWFGILAATKSGSALTGSAAGGKVGPILGLLDIGECNDSYLFHVSLPGVKRNSSDFSCEVDKDGRVLIQGVTTIGEKTVRRYGLTFEMQSQNLCPPGPFSISFKLPGPVDPQQFVGNFGTDGILEGFVMKAQQNRLRIGPLDHASLQNLSSYVRLQE